MKYIKNIIFGALIGIANVIPGVSGGTMAVILNIYDKILYAISFKNIKKNLMFLIPLALGGVLGIFFFSKFVKEIMITHPIPLSFAFIGLIIGSIPAIYTRARETTVKPRNVVLGIVSLAVMITLAIIGGQNMSGKTLAQFGAVDAKLFFWLFIGGIICTLAMIIPGISGSLLLVIMGIYNLVIEAVSEQYVSVLIPLFIGAVIGLFIGLKMIKKMLRVHPQALYFIVLGLIIGSILSVYDGFAFDMEGLFAVIVMIAFGALAFFFSRGTGKDN